MTVRAIVFDAYGTTEQPILVNLNIESILGSHAAGAPLCCERRLIGTRIMAGIINSL